MIPPRGTLLERPYNIQSDEVVISEHRNKRALGSPGSAIPTYKGGTTQRDKVKAGTDSSPTKKPTTATAIAAPSAPSYPQKLKMQSPQKVCRPLFFIPGLQHSYSLTPSLTPIQLRERLHSEQQALQNLDSGLQVELSKIGSELSQLSLGPSTNTTSTSMIAELQTQLTQLSTSIPPQVSTLQSHISALSTELSTTVASLEKRCHQMDKLYKEANAENEALYDRVNDELGKIVRSVTSGGKRKKAEAAKEGLDGTAGTTGAEEMLLARLEEKERELKKLRAERAKGWRRDAVS